MVRRLARDLRHRRLVDGVPALDPGRDVDGEVKSRAKR
jgi:hypothetical protein